MPKFRVKDSEDCIITKGDWIVKACDVDAEGYVENIDIIYENKLLYCVNTQSECDGIIGILFGLLLDKLEIL